MDQRHQKTHQQIGALIDDAALRKAAQEKEEPLSIEIAG
jgi:hypothetical protein